MRKYLALFKNEWMKLSHRALLIVGIVALLVVPPLVAVSMRSSVTYTDNSGSVSQTPDQSQLQELAQVHLDELAEQQSWYDPAASDVYTQLEYKANELAQTALQSLMDSRLDLAARPYIQDLLDQQARLQAALTLAQNSQAQGFSESDQLSLLNEMGGSEVAAEQTLTQLGQVLTDGSFEAYRDYLLETSGSVVSGADYQAALAEAWAMVPTEDQQAAWLYDSSAYTTLRSLTEQYAAAEVSMARGYDVLNGTEQPLRAQERQSFQDLLLELRYELKNPAASVTELAQAANNSDSVAKQLNLIILCIGILIAAGSFVSQEMETGSIKSLIISPTRRYKIYLAKLGALLLIALALAAFSWLVRLLSLRIVFGSLSGLTQVIAHNGSLHVWNYWQYTALDAGLGYLTLAVIVFFALAVSTVTRRTAVAVGLTLGSYFGLMVTESVLANFGWKEAFRFLPLMNLDFSTRLLSDASRLMTLKQFGSTPQVNISVGFSALYVLILAGLLLWMGLDSFCRRDI